MCYRNWLISRRLLAASAACFINAAHGSPLIPVEKFAEIPVAREVRLSPDGSKIAILSYTGGHEALLIRSLAGGDVAIEFSGYETAWVAWKNPQRLVVGVFASTDTLYWGSPEREYLTTRMFAVDADGKNMKSIGEPPGGFWSRHLLNRPPVHPQIEDELASFLDDDPAHLLQTVIDEFPISDAMPARHRHAVSDEFSPEDAMPAVYRVDIGSGAHQMVVRPHPHLLSYRADSTGAVRLGFGTDGTDRVIYVRDNEDDDWRMIHRDDANGIDTFQPLAFVPDRPSPALCHRPKSCIRQERALGL